MFVFLDHGSKVRLTVNSCLGMSETVASARGARRKFSLVCAVASGEGQSPIRFLSDA